MCLQYLFSKTTLKHQKSKLICYYAKTNIQISIRTLLLITDNRKVPNAITVYYKLKYISTGNASIFCNNFR